MSVTLLAPAKINLSLDVIGKREDGYHLLSTVMQTVSLYDRITAQIAETGITLVCGGGIPADESNTAYKAAARFAEAIGWQKGFAITVEKAIPSQAGLAGGSADAAGVLHALNRLTEAGLSVERLCEIGVKIGADVPFCVQGGTVLCGGIGEELTQLPALPACFIVIVKPDGGVSTPEAYRLIDNAPTLFHPDTEAQCAALKAGDLRGICAQMGNTFEQPLALPETAPIRRVMEANGVLASALSGSGSAVFGVFETKEQAKRCAAAFGNRYPFCVVCTPCDGVMVE